MVRNPTVGIAGILVAGALTLGWTAFAQELAFEAASVKLNKSGTPNGRVNKTPGRFVGTNAPTRSLIREAYGLKDYQLYGGPSWLDSDRFDVEGKAESAADDAHLQAMLRTLMAERFKLVVHRETKEMSVYNLLVGKNGIKFPEIKAGEPWPPMAPKREGAVQMFAVSISALADMLSTRFLLDRPVLDKTGLTGKYAIDIQYGRDEDIVTVVQDQGLKLESAKGPIEVVVIDHVEKPSEN
jgi:uncharacterized protein (TIGR03435 family)